MIKIILTSDLHFLDTGMKNKTKGYMDKVLQTLKSQKIDANIVTGDLTNFDEDGSHCCCFYYGGKTDQVDALKNTYINPVEKLTKMYACLGNHDMATVSPSTYKPMVNYMNQKYGDLRYSFDIQGIHFVSLHIYPDSDSLSFLTNDMAKNKDKPTILFFHYNLTGEWSDWWTNVEKDTFYETIKNYKIIGLFVGHRHQTYTDTWRGLQVFSGAGDDSFYLINIDTSTLKITATSI